MAEILVQAVDATHKDPEKDRRGCYKRGMPVVVQPDGHPWGKRESLPKFVVLKLPGVPVDKVLRFIAPDEIDDGTEEDGVTPRRVVYRRRLWKLFVDEIPLAVRRKLAEQGSLTIGPTGDYTWTQLRTFIRNLRDNSTAPSTL